MGILKRKNIHSLLIATVVLQVLILSGEYLNSVYPLWLGEKVRLAVRPVDPRSLFRGNYARLDYDMSSIDLDLFDRETGKDLTRGSVIYVILEKQGEIWVPQKASLEKPSKGLFIRGRVQHVETVFKARVRYGIEAYFAPKEKAMEIETRMRRDADKRITMAEVMIAPNGKAALSGIRYGNHY